MRGVGEEDDAEQTPGQNCKEEEEKESPVGAIQQQDGLLYIQRARLPGEHLGEDAGWVIPPSKEHWVWEESPRYSEG